MPALSTKLAVVLACLALSASAHAEDILSGDPGDGAMQYRERVFPFLDRYCLPCHESEDPEGDLDLTGFLELDDLLAAPGTWREVARRLSTGEMPPEKSPRQPDRHTSQAVARWIDRQLGEAAPLTSGERVSLRRLNRLEYRNSVRDLLGFDHAPAASFPSDEVAHGFDNVAEAQSVSPLLFERYLEAARAIAARAIVDEDPDDPPVRRFGGRELSGVIEGKANEGEVIGFYSSGAVAPAVRLPRAGDYLIRVEASADQAGPEKARMQISLDGKRMARIDVKGDRGDMAFYQRRIRASAGPHVVRVAFINDYYRPDDPDRANRDRNLYVRTVEVVGPVDQREDMPASHSRILLASPDGEDWSGASRSVLEPLVRRAWRREPQEADLERLEALVHAAREQGANFPGAIRLALAAILAHPGFLFRREDAVATDDFQLASRLSYFLWSSMPDDRLLELAGAGGLRQVIGDEARRMLQDPRAGALVDGFADQWLELRRLGISAPDGKLFPAFDEELRASMRTETQMLFEHVMSEDLDVRELLGAEYSFLDERLARHYDIEGVRGDRFRKVALPDGRRGGLLGQASILTLTSYPTRTSPVKRGKWILQQLLGEPPPSPPPGVPDLDESDEARREMTLRERMEAHRENPDCAACHAKMDPLGFSLEHYDAIGVWRDREGAHEIDCSGELPDGRRVDGAGDLRALLMEDPAFPRTLAEKLLVYALGRGLDDEDRSSIDGICDQAAGEGDRFSAFVAAIVESPLFKGAGDHAGTTDDQDGLGRETDDR